MRRSTLYIWFLLSTIFLTSACTMILEIIGAKLISPIFGASHFVWMSQITITLLALSVGAYLSTYLPKKNLAFLFFILFGSSLYSILTNFFFREIAFSLLNLPFIGATIITSLLLYFIPLTSLGLVFPYLTDEIKDVSNNPLGKVSALSTLGSIFGTLLSGIVLIRYFDNQSILFYTFCVNVFWSLNYLFVKDKLSFHRAMTLMMTLVIGGAISLIVFKPNDTPNGNIKVIENKNSPFGEVIVVEQGFSRMILNDGITQITYNYIIDKPSHHFIYALRELALLSRPNLKKVLHIGVGPGIIPTDFQKRGIENTAVEINPAMIEIAKKYFKYDDTKIKTIIQDGRFFIKQTQEKYDAIILDAFLVDSVPVFLLTQEAFQEMKKILNQGGIIVINSFGRVNPPTVLTASLSKTLKTVFKNSRIYTLDQFNVFFLASDDSTDFKGETDYEEVNPEVREKVRTLLSKEIPIDDSKGIIMTDHSNRIEVFDDNPTELFRKKVLLGFMKKDTENLK